MRLISRTRTTPDHIQRALDTAEEARMATIDAKSAVNEYWKSTKISDAARLARVDAEVGARVRTTKATGGKA